LEDLGPSDVLAKKELEFDIQTSEKLEAEEKFGNQE